MKHRVKKGYRESRRAARVSQRTLWRAAPLLAAVCLLSAACGSSSTAAPGVPRKSGRASAGVVKLGFVAERSGIYQAYGVLGQQAAELAVHNINASGGVKIGSRDYRFQLQTCNDHSTSALATACALKLVRDDHVKYMFGGISSMGTAIVPVTSAAHVLYLAGSTAVNGEVPFPPYTVATLPSASNRLGMMVKAIAAAFPSAKRIGMIGVNNATTTALFGPLTRSLEKTGITVTGTQLVPATVTDYSSSIVALAATHPEAIVTYVDSPSALQELVTQSAQIGGAGGKNVFAWGFGCSSLGQVRPKGLDYVGDTAVGADLRSSSSAAVRQFVVSYEKYFKVGSLPKSNAYSMLWTYDFYGILRKAMETAGTVTNTTAVWHVMNKITYHGVEGKIQIVNYHPVFRNVMCHIEHGKTSTLTVEP